MGHPRRLVAPSRKHGWVDSDDPILKEGLIWFEKEFLLSKPYRELKTSACHVVYSIFKTKCQMVNVGSRRYPLWEIENNGELEFTYTEAEEEYGISNQKFKRALTDLIDKGFIDITKRCRTNSKEPNLYEISDRWRFYGKRAFIRRSYKKAAGHIGFKEGNQYGKNCDPKAMEKYRREEQNKRKILKQKKLTEIKSELIRLKRQRVKYLCEKKKLNDMLDNANREDKAEKREELRKLRKYLIYNKQAMKSKTEYLENLSP